MKVLLWIARVIFGLVFMFSGFVKAIDPLGSTYKFQDYFLAFGLDWLFSLALPLAIALSTLEFLIGLNILLGIKMRQSAWGGLIFMLFFTPLTLYMAIYNPVPDCGCFGDAIIISNWQTFYKNIVFLAAAVFIFIKRKEIRPFWSERNDWNLSGAIALAGILLSVYCLRNLPIIDFRPWKTGNNVPALMIPQPEEAEVFLIFENQQTGELAEYPANDYPWDDAAWNELWKFKDQRRQIIRPYVAAPTDDFRILDEFGNDQTETYIANPGYQLIIVAYDLLKTNRQAFERRITPLARAAEEYGYELIVLSGSTWEVIDAFRHQLQTPYKFYQADAVKLKTIIRSNPGLTLMKNGIVLGHWAHRNIPDFDSLRKKYMP